MGRRTAVYENRTYGGVRGALAVTRLSATYSISLSLCDLNHHCYKDSEKVDADFKMMEDV